MARIIVPEVMALTIAAPSTAVAVFGALRAESADMAGDNAIAASEFVAAGMDPGTNQQATELINQCSTDPSGRSVLDCLLDMADVAQGDEKLYATVGTVVGALAVTGAAYAGVSQLVRSFRIVRRQPTSV